MNKVFIYYSLTGNGDVVADYFKKRGFDTEKIISKDKMPKNKALRILKGGFLATMEFETDIETPDINVKKYKEIIIGSPVWNSRLTPPINALLNELFLSEKKVTFVLYSASGTAPKAVKKINTLYPKSKVIVLKEPLKNKEELKKLDVINL